MISKSGFKFALKLVGSGLVFFFLYAALWTHYTLLLTDSFNLTAVPEPVGSYIIYRCLRNNLCGGYADRQKGIVVSYLISVLLERKFAVQIERPCSIEYFLQPNEIDWTVPQAAHTQNHSSWIRLDGSAMAFRKNLASIDLQQEFKNPTTYITTNIEMVRYFQKTRKYHSQLGWTANMSYDQVYSNVLRKLFRLTKPVQAMVDTFLQSIPQNRSLICAQIRTGNNPSIPDDSETRSTQDDIKTIWTFLDWYNDTTKYRLFVATDSETVKQESLRRYPNLSVTIPGRIRHVDRLTSDGCNGIDKVIADQEALGHCNTLVVTNSGLGRIAAFFRGTAQNLYCYTKHGVKPCNFTSPAFIKTNW